MTNLAALIQEFKDLASNHAFIKRFGNGPIENIETFAPSDGKYPVLWVIPQQVTLDDNSVIYNIRILVFDINKINDSLRDQILNDTLITINDVIKQFRLGGSNGDYELPNAPQAFPFEQKFVDYCVGWYSDLQIYTDAMNSPCDFPS